MVQILENAPKIAREESQMQIMQPEQLQEKLKPLDWLESTVLLRIDGRIFASRILATSYGTKCRCLSWRAMRLTLFFPSGIEYGGTNLSANYGAVVASVRLLVIDPKSRIGLVGNSGDIHHVLRPA